MTSKAQKPAKDNFDEDQVVAWLKSNPDFFTRHQSCLSAITLAVSSGPAISLHQYQVRVLRDEKTELKDKLGALVKNAKTNHKIHTDLLDLASKLIGLTRPTASLEQCLEAIRHHFGLCSVKLVDRKNNSTLFKQFKSAVGNKGTLCDNNADTDLLKALFKDNADNVASIAIIAILKAKKHLAYLVLASDEAERYQTGMGGEFLKLLAQLVVNFYNDAAS